MLVLFSRCKDVKPMLRHLTNNSLAEQIPPAPTHRVQEVGLECHTWLGASTHAHLLTVLSWATHTQYVLSKVFSQAAVEIDRRMLLSDQCLRRCCTVYLRIDGIDIIFSFVAQLVAVISETEKHQRDKNVFHALWLHVLVHVLETVLVTEQGVRVRVQLRPLSTISVVAICKGRRILASVHLMN